MRRTCLEGVAWADMANALQRKQLKSVAAAIWHAEAKDAELRMRWCGLQTKRAAAAFECFRAKRRAKRHERDAPPTTQARSPPTHAQRDHSLPPAPVPSWDHRVFPATGHKPAARYRVSAARNPCNGLRKACAVELFTDNPLQLLSRSGHSCFHCSEVQLSDGGAFSQP